MACTGQCLGMATGPVCHLKLQKDALVSLFPLQSQLVHPTLPRFNKSLARSSLPLQQGTAGDNNNYKGVVSCSSLSTTRNRPAAAIVRGVIAMASQEGGISTLVVQEVEFFWKGQGSEVLLSGDFLNWESKVPMEKGPNGWFVVKQKLAPGKYTFKFIVDGQWQHSPDYQCVPDNANGFNNEMLVTEEPSSSEAAGSQTATNALGSEAALQSRTADTPAVATEATGPTRPKPTAAAGEKVANTMGTAATEPVSNVGPSPAPDAGSARPKPVPAAGGKKVAKAAAVVKSLESTMVEDVIPELSTFLKKQDGVSDVELTFVDNELQGCYAKNEVTYSFWVYFPDGKLEGMRGFSLSSHGSAPSTIEPFLIDEKKITGDLVVFWVSKRLFAQKLLSTN